MNFKSHSVVPLWGTLGKIEKPFPLRWADELWQHSIHMELKMAWIALKTIGLLPLFQKQPPASGGRRIFIYALQAAYAGGFYLALAYFALSKAVWVQRTFLRSQHDTSMHRALMHSLLLITHLLIGPLQWMKMPRVLQFLKDWDAFQEYFLRVTRHTLRLNMFWISSISTVVAVAGCIGISLVVSHLILGGDVVGSLYYNYAATQIAVLLNMWVLLCLASAKAADQLAKRFQKDLANSEEIGDNLVNEYQGAWLRLSQLTRDIGNAFCHVFNLMVSFWLAEMLFSVFNGEKILVHNCDMKKFAGVGSLALASYLSILVFCFAANYATDAVSRNFLKFIADIEVENVNVQKQLHDFALAVATHGAVISLGGFYAVNRSLVVSIMSAFATFTVVLFQSPSDDDSFEC